MSFRDAAESVNLVELAHKKTHQASLAPQTFMSHPNGQLDLTGSDLGYARRIESGEKPKEWSSQKVRHGSPMKPRMEPQNGGR